MAKLIKSCQSADTGKCKINVTSSIDNLPVENATIQISFTGDPDSVIEETKTDANGQTDSIPLASPPLEYSMEPSENQPYSEYTYKITAENFIPITISGSQILPDVTATSDIKLKPVLSGADNLDTIIIGAHTLYGNYPPKIAEAEVKNLSASGEIVLSKVVVPEYIIVHNGSVTDSTAKDYYVKYKDYIKNVASCEIYATWPRATLEANILAIMSFTLNRVYTEWYRNKGYDFTITSSTAFDHKWIYGKNTYDSINTIVDEIFTNYLSRPNVKQPILTQYCDGKQVSCPQWMTQWGSKYLGDDGYSAIEILRNYYGQSMYINTAQEISGIPASWPGEDLSIGSSGSKVKQLQEQLNGIRKGYPSIPAVTPDGSYGEQTKKSVEKFQNIFGLPVTGIVDYPTWYKISELYVGVSGIAELNP